MNPYYYVYRTDETRGPKIKHHTLKSAQIEAERLANQHPSSVFEILKTMAVVRCTIASTFWMDGENWKAKEEPPPEPEAPKEPFYRTLGMCEVLEKGDQLMSNGHWIPAVDSIGLELGKSEFPAARRPL